MNIFTIAKDIEQQGFEHYLEIFTAIEKKSVVPPVGNSPLAEQAKKAFQSISEHFKTAGIPAIDHDDAFEKALEFENKSIQFYTEMQSGKEFADESNKSVLLYIISQEQMHARLITSLMEFFRHPGEWLENAEWNHLDDY